MLTEAIKDQLLKFSDGPMLHPDIKSNFDEKITEIRNLSGESEFYQGKCREEFFVKNSLLIVDEKFFHTHSALQKEIFGPFCTIVQYESIRSLREYLYAMEGQLTCSIFSTNPEESTDKALLLDLAIQKAGRILLNDVPTGVSVSKAMHHGGPYPASSDSRFTAVGSDSIKRFLRDVTIQKKCI
jgi:NADP-dependent aldehyde dehydrogenase